MENSDFLVEAGVLHSWTHAGRKCKIVLPRNINLGVGRRVMEYEHSIKGYVHRQVEPDAINGAVVMYDRGAAKLGTDEAVPVSFGDDPIKVKPDHIFLDVDVPPTQEFGEFKGEMIHTLNIIAMQVAKCERFFYEGSK